MSGELASNPTTTTIAWSGSRCSRDRPRASTGLSTSPPRLARCGIEIAKCRPQLGVRIARKGKCASSRPSGTKPKLAACRLNRRNGGDDACAELPQHGRRDGLARICGRLAPVPRERLPAAPRACLSVDPSIFDRRFAHEAATSIQECRCSYPSLGRRHLPGHHVPSERSSSHTRHAQPSP